VTVLVLDFDLRMKPTRYTLKLDEYCCDRARSATRLGLNSLAAVWGVGRRDVLAIPPHSFQVSLH